MTDIEKAREARKKAWALIMQYCPNPDDLHLVLGGYFGTIRKALDQAAQPVDVEGLEREIIELIEHDFPLDHDLYGIIHNDRLKVIDHLNQRGLIGGLPEIELINRDEQLYALFDAIREIRLGNQTDDKLILANLNKKGFFVAKAYADRMEKKD